MVLLAREPDKSRYTALREAVAALLLIQPRINKAHVHDVLAQHPEEDEE